MYNIRINGYSQLFQPIARIDFSIEHAFTYYITSQPRMFIDQTIRGFNTDTIPTCLTLLDVSD